MWPLSFVPLGQVNLCEEPRAVGITEDGGFAEYVLVPRDLVDQGNLLRFGPGVDPAAVALDRAARVRSARSRSSAGSETGTSSWFTARVPWACSMSRLARLAGAAS